MKVERFRGKRILITLFFSRWIQKDMRIICTFLKWNCSFSNTYDRSSSQARIIIIDIRTFHVYVFVYIYIYCYCIDYFLLNILKIYKNNYTKLGILKYNWQRNFRLIFAPVERWAMNLLINDTHASREIPHFTRRPSMNVPEETFFLAARRAPGCSVL